MHVRRSARFRARLNRGRHTRGESGTSALEFALVVPLLVMLLLGVSTLGLAYSDHLSITNAVRESARLGSAVDYTPTGNAWGDSVQTRVQQAYFNAGSTIQTSQICVQLLKVTDGTTFPPSTSPIAGPAAQGANCGAEPATPDNVATGTCLVKVWVRKPARVTLGVLPDINITLGARSVSFYGRAVGSCTTP
jgi:Flp pilus assembly protein TadG